MDRRTFLLLAAPACAGAASRLDSAPHPPSGRSVVYGRRGMVAAAHPHAVGIGVEMLRRGGSAVDAAIAVNAALAVVEPMMCGVGGDLFAQVWDPKTGDLAGLNASGRAPRAISAAKVKPDAAGGIPLDSQASWTVPGAVEGWFALHARFGRLPMDVVLAPAIEAAREGVAVPRVIAADWRPGGGRGYEQTFLPLPHEGQVVRNPALGQTLALIARGGRDAFYQGAIMETIVAFSRQHGGFFAPEDFAGPHAEWVTPMWADYRGVTVWQLPPNGQGLAVLQMLNVLETFDLRGMGRASPDFWHTMIEVKKLVFEDRARHYAALERMRVPLPRFLSKDYARSRARLVDPGRAAARVSPGLDRADTTYLATADDSGMMVSLIQSNYLPCGSGWVPDGLGFCLQNRGAQFSLVPGTPNALEGGARPFHTIIPGFATRDGKPWLAFGVMGGDVQPQGQVQVLVNLIDFQMSLQEAGDAPRFRHKGSTEPAGAMRPMADGGVVCLEPGVPERVRAELQRRGHRLGDETFFGGFQAVARDPDSGVFAGATESRKDGCAMGL